MEVETEYTTWFECETYEGLIVSVNVLHIVEVERWENGCALRYVNSSSRLLRTSYEDVMSRLKQTMEWL